MTGESYGGVYGPTLSLRLVQMIDAGTLDLNFKVGTVFNPLFIIAGSELARAMFGPGYIWLGKKKLENLMNH